ncbi:uncharacterized protein [Dysidea avara]|uniref:uncharacterized protein n=1 Tax=Dysidea avara TaxID=196820 RepID=UPI00332033DB
MALTGAMMALTNNREHITDGGHTIPSRDQQGETAGIKNHYITDIRWLEHSCTGKLSPNVTPYEVFQHIVRFISDHPEENGTLLPARIPGYKRDDIKILPSSISKKNTLYDESCIVSGMLSVGLSTFCRYWKTLLPHIIIGKPMSDLCWTCHQNSEMITRSINRCEGEKSQAIKTAERHLKIVKEECDYYKKQCKDSRTKIKALFMDGEEYRPTPVIMQSLPMSKSLTAHYNFDIAQQIITDGQCVKKFTQREKEKILS